MEWNEFVLGYYCKENNTCLNCGSHNTFTPHVSVSETKIKEGKDKKRSWHQAKQSVFISLSDTGFRCRGGGTVWHIGSFKELSVISRHPCRTPGKGCLFPWRHRASVCMFSAPHPRKITLLSAQQIKSNIFHSLRALRRYVTFILVCHEEFVLHYFGRRCYTPELILHYTICSSISYNLATYFINCK